MRDLADAADVLDAVGLREAEIAVEAVADVVAVEQEGVAAERVEAALDQVGDRRLARSGEAGEPEDAGALALLRGVGGAGDVDLLPVDVGGAADGLVDHAGGDGGVGLAIDEDEAAERGAVGVAFEDEGAVGADLDDADVVDREGGGGAGAAGGDVDDVARRLERGDDGLGGELEEVAAAGDQRRGVHPDDRGDEGVGDLGRAGGGGDDVAAGAVDLVGEDQGDRGAGVGARALAVGTEDARDGGGAAGGDDADLVADRDAAGGDEAGEAAEVLVGAVDPLHGHAERPVGGGGDLDRLEMGEQRRSVVPGHRGGGVDDVGAGQARQRDGGDPVDADRAREVAIVGDDRVEGRLVVADEVHLVHREHDVADADELDEVAVAAGLREDALARVDQDDGEVGGRRAGDHVAGILLVAGGVGDDELARRGGEEAVGDVDGDALLALRRQPVDEEGEVEVGALRAGARGIGGERVELVGEDGARIVEEATDQRRLAVVDRAAGDEAQHRLGGVARQVRVDVARDERVGGIGVRGTHQKYPSRFFFSMLAAWSWSMTRPWRSEVVVSSISWITAGRVSAVLSTAPDSG